MALIPFTALPDSSRLWIFSADRAFEPDGLDAFCSQLDPFLDQWQAHGNALAAGREIRYNQFLFVAADEDAAAPSGCSIDTLTREVSALGERFGVRFLSGGGAVAFRSGAEIANPDRASFKKLVESGEVTGETIVFDNTLTRLRELRDEKWEIPARESWHIRAFKFPIAA